MFFRRPSFLNSGRRSSHVSRKARGLAARSTNARSVSVVEPLERRQLLTTLTGGGGSGGNQQTAIYEFLDGDQNTIRIAMRGNVTAEFIGLWVAASDNELPLSATRNIITDMIQPNQQNPLAEPGTFLPGAYLYSIHISAADPDASISIAQVPPQSTTPTDRPMQPFGSSAGQLRIFNTRTNESDTVSPAGSSGGVFLGGRTGDTIESTDEEEDIAILSEVLKQDFGVRPRTPKVLTKGHRPNGKSGWSGGLCDPRCF
jgi:hypothetical protein